MERKKSKIITALLAALLLLLPSILWALPSQSDFIPLQSSFYSDLDTLLVTTGENVNMTRPYTYGEAGSIVDSLGKSVDSEAEEILYRKLQKDTETAEGSDDAFNFSLAGELAAQSYIHYNTEVFRDPIKRDSEGKLVYKYQNSDKYGLWDREKPHFLDLGLSLTAMDRVTLLFTLPFTNTVHTGTPSGSRVWMTNIPIFSSLLDTTADSFQDVSMNFPYRAYISIADDWYSVQLGRERLNYGSGITGSMVISDALPYHNSFSFSLFSSSLKYSFLLSFFPYPDQYLSDDLVFNQNSNAFTGIKFFMVHRFDWTMDSGRHRFAVSEGIMYQNDKGIVDLQVLNPMMFFHNMYIAGNSNSILLLEWDAAITDGLRQQLALAIDDFNIPFESEDGSERRPNAIGIQYGLRTSHSLGQGFLESAFELVYMSPYFYLRDGKEASDYPLDFVVAIRNQRSGEGVYDLYTIGYPNGGDQFIAHIDLSYTVPLSWSVAFGAEYRLYGQNNLMTKYNSKADPDKVNSHQVILEAGTEVFLTQRLSLNAGLEATMIFNFDNDKGRFEHDCLFTIGCSYRF